MVVELKAGAFKPEYAGELNFYLTVVDVQMRGEHDAPTIGLLRCKQRGPSGAISRRRCQQRIRHTAKAPTR